MRWATQSLVMVWHRVFRRYVSNVLIGTSSNFPSPSLWDRLSGAATPTYQQLLPASNGCNFWKQTGELTRNDSFHGPTPAGQRRPQEFFDFMQVTRSFLRAAGTKPPYGGYLIAIPTPSWDDNVNIRVIVFLETSFPDATALVQQCPVAPLCGRFRFRRTTEKWC